VILLWGLPGDGPIAAVAARLRECRVPYLLLDQRRVARTEVEFCAGPGVGGRVAVGGRELGLDEVTAVYLRPYDSRRVPSVAAAGPLSGLWAHAAEQEDILMSWAELTPALVVNRPEAMTSNDSKPRQLQLIARAGFSVPPTLVTTDPEAAAAFWEEHGEVVYKSVSSTRSIVARLDRGHRDRLADVTWCPTQFQRRIGGTDYRVHVVGDEMFSAAVESDRDDYRYAVSKGGEVRVRAEPVPPGVAERCLRLSRSLGLAVSGIDLRRTPGGEWYCFEANPSPGFTFYQQQTGQPIDAAVAALLAAAKGAKSWCRGPDLNWGHLDFQSSALPG
jgi:hypothetical protein